MKKLLRMDDDDVGAAKDQIQRHGAATIFWARYIFGLRTIAGPLSGMLGMEWKKFLLYNALGAITWVTAIAMVGFGFASRFENLMAFFEKVSWSVAAGVFTAGYLLWREKKHYRQKHDEERT